VALGRAIVREPQVFLMDEPLSNLDAKLRVQTRAELVALHRRLATTTIYVTHDQVEAMTMGERIAVLRDGVLQQVDVPQELYDHPANVFVAGFIGSPAMNFLSARLEQDDTQTRVRGAGFQVLLADTLGEDAKPFLGKEVLVGVRPEHIVDARETAGDESPSARARVDVVEPLGAEVYAHLSIEAGDLVARFNPRRTPRVGDVIEVMIAPESLHLFDPATEASLWNGGPARADSLVASPVSLGADES
jgi:multiple sugar transport system ATP-binding protein